MNLDDIKSTDTALVAAFQKFTTRVQASENFYFWFDKGNNEGKYAKYIKHGAPRELTLDNSDLMKSFNALAAQGKYHEMDPLFVRARAEVHGMLGGRVHEFETSKEYKDYLAVKKLGNIDKALKLLGVDSAHAANMKTALKEYAVSTTDAEKHAAIAKMEKLAKHEQIMAALKSAGLA